MDINQILADWADEVIKKIQSNLESTGTNASGRTSESLEYTVDSDGLTIYGRQYFQGVEKGRPGGGIPYNMTDIIRQWMTDKGIEDQFGTTESQKRSAAYLIGNYIKEHGTQLYRKGGREDIYTNVLEEEVPKLEEYLVTYISGTIADSFTKISK